MINSPKKLPLTKSLKPCRKVAGNAVFNCLCSFLKSLNLFQPKNYKAQWTIIQSHFNYFHIPIKICEL